VRLEKIVRAIDNSGLVGNCPNDGRCDQGNSESYGTNVPKWLEYLYGCESRGHGLFFLAEQLRALRGCAAPYAK